MKLITKDPIVEIAYLVIGVLLSLYFIFKAKKRVHYYMFGFLGLFLMLNDLCALFPSSLDYYGLNTMKDYLSMLGIGKAISAVLLTVSLVIAFWVYKIKFNKKTSVYLDLTVYVLAFIKIIFTIIPPDEVVVNEIPYLYGALSSLPLIALLVLAVIISYRTYKSDNDEAIQYICAIILSLSVMSESTIISFKSFSTMIVSLLIPVSIIVSYLIIKDLRSIRKKE